MQAILFDLDNTLYPAQRDLFSLIDVRINRFMREVAAIADAEVDGLRRRYWRDYGATLQGLIRHHAIDPEDYLHYVHDVDVASRLTVDADLRRSLGAIAAPCFVFTNGSRQHAERVLTALGVDDLFTDIFDIRVADYQPKPNPEPYRGVLQRLGVPAARCVMVEDSAENLRQAGSLGMRTVLVAAGDPVPGFDLQVESAAAAADAIAAGQVRA